MTPVDRRHGVADGPVRAWRTSSIQTRPANPSGAPTAPRPGARERPQPQPGWMAKGACVDLPVEQQRQFVADEASEQRKAAEICNTRCTVRAACDEHATRTGQTAGVWGGLTEGQRAHRQRRKGRGRGR